MTRYRMISHRMICKGWAALALAALALGGLGAAPAHADGRPALRWSGDVDDTTLVYFHADDVRTRDVSGKASRQTSAEVFDRLPRGPIQVYLTRREGRGQVRVVQQPTPDNGFTAAVRIHDPQPGRGHYDFALAWAPLAFPGHRSSWDGDAYGGGDGDAYGGGVGRDHIFRGAIGGGPRR